MTVAIAKSVQTVVNALSVAIVTTIDLVGDVVAVQVVDAAETAAVVAVEIAVAVETETETRLASR